MENKFSSWLKTLLWLIALAIIFIPTFFAIGRFKDSYDWERALASSDRLGSLRSAGESTDLSESTNYLYLAVLVEPGARCTYFIDGIRSDLPSPFNRPNASARNALQVSPSTDDLKDINIDGRTWDWVSTIQKSNNNERTISCDSNYILIERPGLSLLQSMALIVGSGSYWALMAFLFYRFVVKPSVKNTSKKD